MEHAQYLKSIIGELAENAGRVSTQEMEKVAELIRGAGKVFVAGAGRSGFVARAFANRLMHLGLSVYFVGEPTTPAIGAGDLLVIGSGSGETGSLVVMARKAKKLGARLATLTIHPEATIGSLADAVIVIPGATPKSALADTVKSVQPMGNAFEQMCWLVYDAIIMILMDVMDKKEDEMFKLHANLE